MAKATKIVVYFDDGSTYEVQADQVGSIFLKETAAVKCGHKPPYGKPPKDETTTFAAMSTTETGGTAGGDATAQGTGCYLVSGVIICP